LKTLVSLLRLSSNPFFVAAARQSIVDALRITRGAVESAPFDGRAGVCGTAETRCVGNQYQAESRPNYSVPYTRNNRRYFCP
jgi:hypothetical protein